VAHEPSFESAEAQSLPKQLAGIFRENYPRLFGGVVSFGGPAAVADLRAAQLGSSTTMAVYIIPCSPPCQRDSGHMG